MSTACFLGGRTRAACLWLLSAFLVHPQMAIYGAGFGLLVAFEARSRERVAFVEAAPALPALFVPFLVHLQPAQGAYREVLASRAYFLVTTWHWWEWVGVIAPLIILAVFAHLSLESLLPAFSRLAKTLIGLGLISTIAALVLASDADFAYLLRLQPMRELSPDLCCVLYPAGRLNRRVPVASTRLAMDSLLWRALRRNVRS